MTLPSLAPLGYRLLVHGMSRGQTDDTGQPDSSMTRTHTYGRGELYTLFDFLQNYENIAINQNNSSRIEK